jgi:T-complex protein 1 subunit eta
MELSRTLRDIALKTPGKEQFFLRGYAKAFETIPFQLCLNAGLDAVDVLNNLRTRHQNGELWAGIDIHREAVGDNFEACVWEPTVVKEVGSYCWLGCGWGDY